MIDFWKGYKGCRFWPTRGENKSFWPKRFACVNVNHSRMVAQWALLCAPITFIVVTQVEVVGESIFFTWAANYYGFTGPKLGNRAYFQTALQPKTKASPSVVSLWGVQITAQVWILIALNGAINWFSELSSSRPCRSSYLGWFYKAYAEFALFCLRIDCVLELLQLFIRIPANLWQ